MPLAEVTTQLSQEKSKAEEFLRRIKQDGRSSPAGYHWAEFSKFLYEHRKNDSDRIPVSLILAASAESNSAKHWRLSEQLDWAIRHECLKEAIAYLENLPNEHWNQGSLESWATEYWD